jgi:hypothetical protein
MPLLIIEGDCHARGLKDTRGGLEGRFRTYFDTLWELERDADQRNPYVYTVVSAEEGRTLHDFRDDLSVDTYTEHQLKHLRRKQNSLAPAVALLIFGQIDSKLRPNDDPDELLRRFCNDLVDLEVNMELGDPAVESIFLRPPTPNGGKTFTNPRSLRTWTKERGDLFWRQIADFADHMGEPAIQLPEAPEYMHADGIHYNTAGFNAAFTHIFPTVAERLDLVIPDDIHQEVLRTIGLVAVG